MGLFNHQLGNLFLYVADSLLNIYFVNLPFRMWQLGDNSKRMLRILHKKKKRRL